MKDVHAQEDEPRVLLSHRHATPSSTIKHFAPDELEARRRIIVSELERRFGSLDAALAQEHTGSHPSEDPRLLGAHHDVMFLLGE